MVRLNSNILRLAKGKALQSPCIHKVSALGFNRKGELVARANNQKRFYKFGGGYHAEERIFKLAKSKGIKIILIFRVSKAGNLLPIDPCKKCAKKAQELGIKIISL